SGSGWSRNRSRLASAFRTGSGQVRVPDTGTGVGHPYRAGAAWTNRPSGSSFASTPPRSHVMTMKEQRGPGASRRDFLKTSSAAVVGGTLASALPASGVFAQGSDEIRVGVIGCGGRGTGAMENVLNAAPGVRIVAVGDLFKDRLETSMKNLSAKHGARATVPADRQFVGWDAYQKVVASDVNYIILATPPAFRPMHLKAAIEAGKHVFTEKPVAVDTAGIRQVYELADLAK